MEQVIQAMKITSNSFSHAGLIPVRYSCHGENINPPLNIISLPPETISLAVIAEDTDAPHGTFDHWVLWNLPPQLIIPENIQLGVKGNNSKDKTGYTGPCPPAGRHRYYFKVFALDKDLDLQEGSGKKSLLAAMKDHIIDEGEIMGYYENNNYSL